MPFWFHFELTWITLWFIADLSLIASGFVCNRTLLSLCFRFVLNLMTVGFRFDLSLVQLWYQVDLALASFSLCFSFTCPFTSHRIHWYTRRKRGKQQATPEKRESENTLLAGAAQHQPRTHVRARRNDFSSKAEDSEAKVPELNFQS